MITHIITRFSILDYNYKVYRLTRKLDIEAYSKMLFSSERLDYKFKSFEMITLPSILNQTNQNYIWHIYTSEYLPDAYKEKLRNLTNLHKSIRVYYIKDFNEFNKIKFDSDYCTMRLDDDDALSPHFIENLQKYKNKINTIISHPNGKSVTIRNDTVIMGKNVSLPNCALGLCAIGMNIYECGNHNKIAEKFSVIYDDAPDMYLINASIHCDTSRKFVADK